MGRYRGYWWSPDGAAIAATRADIGPVQRWYISDPANPDQQANEVAYPAAGTPNADVTLHVLALDGGSTEVVWDRDTYPYLADVQWADSQWLLLTVQSRADQRSLMVLAADPRHGGTEPVFADGDTAWVELVPGTPAVLDDGQLVMTADRDGARRLMVDGNAVTPIDLQVRAVVTAQDDEVYFLANPIADATVQHVWRWRTDGTLAALTDEPGVHTVAIGGSTVVLRTAVLDEPGATTQVVDGPTISTFAEQPLVTPNLSLHRYGDKALATAVLLPSYRTAGDDGPLLPVLLDPYGGPHAGSVCCAAQRVPHLAVVRRPRVRGRRHRRARYAGPWERVGTVGAAGSGHRPTRRSSGSARSRGAGTSARSHTSGHPWVELRRLPRGACRSAPARCVPCGHRRCAGHRVAAVRHALHRALLG